MAKANKVQVLEKSEGTKIAWSQNGNKLVFGDDDLSIRCDTRQRDYPVHVDICADDDGNLVIGVGTGRYYVAQVDIPATVYEEYEEAPEEAASAEESGLEDGMGQNTPNVRREAQPIDMGEVVLTLWSIDDIRRFNQ